MGFYLSLYCCRCLFLLPFSRDATITASPFILLRTLLPLSFHFPPNSIQCHLSSLHSSHPSLLCMLPSATNLAPLPPLLAEVEQTGFLGEHLRRMDTSRGGGGGIILGLSTWEGQRGVGQWCERLASLAAWAPAARQGGGAGGGSALMGSNLQ